MIDGPPHRSLCTDCGVSRTAAPGRCGTACQFIKPDYPSAERKVHGRTAHPERGDEAFFGVYQRMHQAALAEPRGGAQWTGLTTRLAERLLEEGKADAVITVKAAAGDRWRPEPVTVTEPHQLADCRGMRMGYAPLLAHIEPALKAGHKRLAVIAIPCQVYAIRALEAEWRRDHGLEALYVIGTPCSDNTSTENFHHFLSLLSGKPETITYLEFRADYHVELRFKDGTEKRIPFLKLPLSGLPTDFFPLTCRTCVDYSNRLADITVGYMAGSGEQWLIIRNDRGAEMAALLAGEAHLKTLKSGGKRRSSVAGFIENTKRAAGGLPLRAMPDWLRPLMGWLMPKIGPKGLEFARARLEMKAAESILHLRRAQPAKMKNMIPKHVWRLTKPYGITPKHGEVPDN